MNVAGRRIYVTSMTSDGDMQSVIDLCQNTLEDKTHPPGEVRQARPSKAQAGPTMSCQTLSIRLDKFPLLKSMREKVQKNYCVTLCEDKCVASDGKSAADTQWISILGSPGDCKDAGVRIVNILCFYGS